eukprot:1268223-Prymnesium_polylepis.1
MHSWACGQRRRRCSDAPFGTDRELRPPPPAQAAIPSLRSLSTPDTPTNEKEIPVPAGPSIPPPLNPLLATDEPAFSPKRARANDEFSLNLAAAPSPPLLPPSAAHDCSEKPAGTTDEPLLSGPKMLPLLDPLVAVNDEMSRLAPLLLPTSSTAKSTADYSAVSRHLYPDLDKAMKPAAAQDNGTAATHHVAFAIVQYNFDSSVVSQTSFNLDDPQTLSDMGLITDARKVLLVPNGHMEPATELQLAWAGLFTVNAASPLEANTSGERYMYQLLLRALETHQFDIGWSLDLQLRKAAELWCSSSSRTKSAAATRSGPSRLSPSPSSTAVSYTHLTLPTICSV